MSNTKENTKSENTKKCGNVRRSRENVSEWTGIGIDRLTSKTWSLMRNRQLDSLAKQLKLVDLSYDCWLMTKHRFELVVIFIVVQRTTRTLIATNPNFYSASVMGVMNRGLPDKNRDRDRDLKSSPISKFFGVREQKSPPMLRLHSHSAI